MLYCRFIPHETYSRFNRLRTPPQESSHHRKISEVRMSPIVVKGTETHPRSQTQVWMFPESGPNCKLHEWIELWILLYLGLHFPPIFAKKG